jgi:hypothetical protein
MRILNWTNVQTLDDHPRLAVAKGTHGLYLANEAPGNVEPLTPQDDSRNSCGLPEPALPEPELGEEAAAAFLLSKLPLKVMAGASLGSLIAGAVTGPAALAGLIWWVNEFYNLNPAWTGCSTRMIVPLCGPGELVKARCSERYLLGRVHCDGPGTTKAGGHVRSGEPDALRRRLPSSPVLVSNRVQAGGRDTGARRAAESPLHCRRDAPVAAVSDDPGARTDRDHAVAATERRLSVPLPVCRVTPRPRRSGASCCGWRRRPSPNCVPCTIAFSAG